MHTHTHPHTHTQFCEFQVSNYKWLPLGEFLGVPNDFTQKQTYTHTHAHTIIHMLISSFQLQMAAIRGIPNDVTHMDA